MCPSIAFVLLLAFQTNFSEQGMKALDEKRYPDAVASLTQAIAADPTAPVLYYLKGNGLVQKTTMDSKTNKLVAPPGCLEAYQKYLQLAPDGTYAAEVKGILAGFNQTVDTSYKAPKKK